MNVKNPAEVYAQMLAELAHEIGDIERKVFVALQLNPQGLKRPQLVAIVFNETRAPEMRNNDAKDRKIRKAIQSLREKGVPIISNSGQAGYRLDASEAGKQAMLADLRSRRATLDSMIRVVSDFRTIPVTQTPQTRMF